MKKKKKKKRGEEEEKEEEEEEKKRTTGGGEEGNSDVHVHHWGGGPTPMGGGLPGRFVECLEGAAAKVDFEVERPRPIIRSAVFRITD